MNRTALAFIFSLAAGPAFAHAGGLPVGPSDLWHHWTLDPWIWAPLLVAHWLYGRGLLRAWRRAARGRVISVAQAASFLAGEALIVLALISPLDALGETLLSTHMVQHIILTTLAPPLLVLGAPASAWAWAAPELWKRACTKAPRNAARFAERLTAPLAATALHAAALWVWHAPAAFDAALVNEGLHTLEHICFLATALLFWQAVFKRRTAFAVGALCIFVTFVQSGMLGGLLSLAPEQVYAAYADRARLWGMSAVEDQQLAGLVMWAPAGAAYFAAFLVLMARMFDPPRSARVAR